MTYRAEEAATRAHLETAQRELERVRTAHRQKTDELASLEQLRRDLDAAIEKRRGHVLGGPGFFRLAALMVVMQLGGALGASVGRTSEGWGIVVRGLFGLMALLAGLWAIRRRDIARKRLAEHDARVAAQAAIPRVRVAQPEPEREPDPEIEAPPATIAKQRARHST